MLACASNRAGAPSCARWARQGSNLWALPCQRCARHGTCRKGGTICDTMGHFRHHVACVFTFL